MGSSYEKDMSRSNWAEVYARQSKRAEQVQAWLDALGLRTGERVLDVGSGPGFISLQVAMRVGPQGRVYALDRSPDALEFLARLQAEQGLSQIETIVADAAALDALPGPVDAFLATMMLHHVDQPSALLAHLTALLPEGARGVVAEFHPEGPCVKGPPREQRVHPDQVLVWCSAAGLAVDRYDRQSPEHYTFLVHKQGRGQ